MVRVKSTFTTAGSAHVTHPDETQFLVLSMVHATPTARVEQNQFDAKQARVRRCGVNGRQNEGTSAGCNEILERRNGVGI